MILLNTICAWSIVLCSILFIQIVFEKDKMTRFHVLERTVLRLGLIYLVIAEIIIGVEAKTVSIDGLLLNVGLAIIAIFLNYQYYNKRW